MTDTWKTVEVRAVPVPSPTGDIFRWLADQPADYGWLLANAFAGVIWGRFMDGRWRLSHEVLPEHSPPLQTETLLQLRLFGRLGEVFVWREGPGLYARHIREGESGGRDVDVLDEKQMVWGTAGRRLDDLFSRVEDGSQGLVHALPLGLGDFATSGIRPVRLHVRHYLDRDEESGLARIWASRLGDLAIEEEKNNGV